MLPPCEYGGRCIFLENFGSSIYFSKIKEKIYEKIPSWQCSQAEQTLPIGLSVVRTRSRTMDAAPHESRDTKKDCMMCRNPQRPAVRCPLSWMARIRVGCRRRWRSSPLFDRAPEIVCLHATTRHDHHATTRPAQS
jgi:hypothetical protein